MNQPADFKKARRLKAELGPNSDYIIPHDERIERHAVGVLLAEPDKAKERIEELSARLFHDLVNREVFCAIRRVSNSGSIPSPDLVLVELQREHKQWKPMAEVIGSAPEESCPPAFPNYVTRLADLSARRDLLDMAEKAQGLALDTTRPLNGAVIDFAELAARLARTERANEELLASRIFHPERRPPLCEVVYALAGVPICTAGNLSVITAAVKAGKSAVVGAMMASTFPNGDCDTLGFTSANPEGKALIHIDSEQSPEDHWLLCSRTLRRAGASVAPNWLLSYCLKGLAASEIRSALRHALKSGAQKFGGIHSVIVDGAADLVIDVNDQGECNPFVAELEALSIEYSCPIVGVIHFNPGSEKTRGHLGSQLERKSMTNLTLAKNGEVTEVYSTKQRRQPIPKGKGPCFAWCSVADMHVTVTGPNIDPIKLERLKIEVAEVFSARPAMRYSDLKSTVMTVTGKTERTAERRIEEYRHAELIGRSVANLFTAKLQ